MDQQREQRPSRRRRVLVLLLGLVLAGGAGGAYWLHGSMNRTSAAARPAPSAVPVSVATVTRRTVPIYLSGLGTAQASNTIAIHTQVDGTLQTVNFVEGQMIAKGAVLAQIDPRVLQAALDQAKAKKMQDEAQLVSAQKDLERFEKLLTRSYETQQNVDRQRATVEQLKATIQADQALIESTSTQLDYTTIRSPIDGRIGIRQVDPGNVVRASDQTTLATVTQTKPISVIFTLPARTLDDVRTAMQRGPVQVTAFDQDNQRQLGTGTLLLVDNLIDQTTATIRLKAIFPNEDERLWPGEFVNARLLVEQRDDALTIPSNAVQRGAQGLFTWVVKPDNTVDTHPLRVGPTSGDVVIVESGLSEGDRVVTEGQYKLQLNAPVAITPPQAAGGGSLS